MPEIELLEYSAVNLPNGDKAILYHSVSLPGAAKPPADPKTVEKLIEYLNDENLKSVLAKIRHTVKGLGKGIEEYATQGYIGYKHSSSRQFAYVKVYRKVIEFGAHIIDEKKQLLDFEGMRLQTGDEDYSEILEKVKTAFINLGGEIKG